MLLLSACDSSDVSGPEPDALEPDEPAELWPLENGTTWTFETRLSETGSESINVTETLTVIGTEERAGEKVTTIRSDPEEGESSFTEIRSLDDGFWFGTIFINTDKEPGDQYTFRYEGVTIQVDVSSTTTTVPAGSFSVVKYTLAAEEEDYSFTADFLFAEGLGLVEYSVLDVEPNYQAQVLGRLADSSLL